MFFIQKGMFLYEWECPFLLIYNKFVAEKLFFDTHNKIFLFMQVVGKKRWQEHWLCWCWSYLCSFPNSLVP